MKTVVRIILGVAIILLAYMCIMSIYTPIQFENEREARERAVIRQLIDIRRAQLEFRDQHGRFVTDLDSLVDFVRTGEKRLVSKAGSLSDAQLEAGLTEARAARIVARGDMAEIQRHGLVGFRRDTLFVPVIKELFPNGEYTTQNIDRLIIIPYSDGRRFDIDVNNEFRNDVGIRIPLFEVRAPFRTYLYDLNRQELLNLEFQARELSRFSGLQVGDITRPNNFAGNWE